MPVLGQGEQRRDARARRDQREDLPLPPGVVERGGVGGDAGLRDALDGAGLAIGEADAVEDDAVGAFVREEGGGG